MSVVDALNHLVNGLAPAIFVGCVTALVVKLLWPGPFKATRWRGLAARACAAGMAASVLGLVLTGHDGQMLNYALMVAANAAVLWWMGRRGQLPASGLRR